MPRGQTNAEAGERRRDDMVEFVRTFVSEHGHPPTIREIAAGVGLASPGAAHRQLARLVADGRLRAMPVTSHSYGYVVVEES